MINVDPLELEKFSQLAHRWWDPGAEFKPLHDINPLRLDYIDGIAGLRGKSVLDVGCGGGILAEGMAVRGARVTGIDLADKPLKVAQLHLLESGLQVGYRLVAPEALAREAPGGFDVVTCMELLEHVPDPAATVQACADLVKPDGRVFFSTLNRNLKAYILAVVGAEYVLKLLPRGTHDYAKFIKPSELAAMCRAAGLSVTGITGMTYNPFSRLYSLGTDADVNYILHATKQ
ncbi:MAG: bifunctional 3-demethylubiquinol 3-O-methyltransferase/2-polyprenyl-6-hydroxyphenol methylase [Betaproteobacteria bacterium RIFCSPLOWO2_02_FULL_67_26]|nr:MAG: bifunctional 3-demethylubiquinol 3-O-methyltransferase/2-polyprenyl-6-hydroxyphenol methylase [Betaproteobacteria bacterium RIFCSPLOWO2_02_FULL_67_26]